VFKQLLTFLKECCSIRCKKNEQARSMLKSIFSGIKKQNKTGLSSPETPPPSPSPPPPNLTCDMLEIELSQTCHCFILFHFVSFCLVSFHFVSFRFVSFRFVSFRFISFHFISFRFILFLRICFKICLLWGQKYKTFYSCTLYLGVVSYSVYAVVLYLRTRIVSTQVGPIL
jgi:hypothetical protein